MPEFSKAELIIYRLSWPNAFKMSLWMKHQWEKENLRLMLEELDRHNTNAKEKNTDAQV